jgi:hypothetical protein
LEVATTVYQKKPVVEQKAEKEAAEYRNEKYKGVGECDE